MENFIRVMNPIGRVANKTNEREMSVNINSELVIIDTGFKKLKKVVNDLEAY